MHRLALAFLLLASCSNNPAPAAPDGPTSQGIPIRGETPGHTCNTARTARFVGQPRTTETGAAIQRASNAAVLRWAPPGAMLTMDYRIDRVTVYLGPDRRITQIKCG